MRYLLFVLAVIALLTSCRKVLDIDIEERDKKIVINSLFNTNVPLTLHISKSMGILEKQQDLQMIENASLSLYENGVFAEAVAHTSNGFYFSTLTPQAGRTYRVVANVSGMNSAEAEVFVPNAVGLSSLDTAVVQVHVSNMDYTYDYYAMNFNLKFIDPPETENYYLITIIQLENTVEGKGYCLFFESEDPFFADKEGWQYFSEGLSGLIFTDDLTGSGEITLSLIMEEYQLMEGLNTLEISLHSISKEEYLYIRSNNLHNQTVGNPFGEPVQVYNNVTGGFGIFAGYSTSSDTLSFDYQYRNQWEP